MLSTFSFAANTIGFVVTKDCNHEITSAINDEILSKIKLYGTVNVYIEDDNIETVTLQSVMDEIFFKLDNASSLNKIAIVTDRNWIHVLTSAESFFSTSQIENFKSKDRLKAINWIAS